MPRLWALKDACSDRVCPMVELFPAPLGHRDNFLWPEAWGGGECLPRPALTRQGTPPHPASSHHQKGRVPAGSTPPLPHPAAPGRPARPPPSGKAGQLQGLMRELPAGNAQVPGLVGLPISSSSLVTHPFIHSTDVFPAPDTDMAGGRREEPNVHTSVRPKGPEMSPHHGGGPGQLGSGPPPPLPFSSLSSSRSPGGPSHWGGWPRVLRGSLEPTGPRADGETEA